MRRGGFVAVALALAPQMAKADVIVLNLLGGAGGSMSSLMTHVPGEREREYVAAGQPYLKGMLQLNLQPFWFLGAVGGLNFTSFGLGADGGEYRDSGSRILHDGALVSAELGLSQHLGRWCLQETLEVGLGAGNEYRVRQTRQGITSFQSQDVRSHTRAAWNLRALRTFGVLQLGAEFTYASGRLELQQGYDTYGQVGGALLVGLGI